MTHTPTPADTFRGRARIPLLIGVAGHLDLEEKQKSALESAVREAFQSLSSAFPATPLVVCTQLAEGADQLVASIALELGASLVVLEPLPAQAFTQAFKAPEAKTHFEHLSAQAETPPIQFFEGTLAEAMALSPSERDAYYRCASHWMTTHASILLALWDGQEDPRLGSTFQTVQDMLHGTPMGPTNALLGGGPVFHVHTQRNGRANASPKAAGWICCGGAPTDSNNPSELLPWSIAERYNRDVLACSDEQLRKAQATAEETLSPDGSDLSVARYAMADALSQAAKKKFMGAIRTVLVSSMVAIASFTLFSSALEFVTPVRTLAALYLVVLGLAQWAFSRARHHRFQYDYLERRCLAEGLRVQLALSSLSLRSHQDGHDLLNSLDEVAWIRRALNACAAQAQQPDHSEASRTAAVKWVQTWWLESQRKFFHSRASDFDERSRRLQLAVSVSWMAAVSAGVLAVLPALLSIDLPALFPNADPDTIGSTVRDSLAAMAAFCFALSSSVGNYEEKLGVEAQSRMYARMSKLFDGYAPRLMCAIDACEHRTVTEIAEALGYEALAENGLWLGMQLSRRLDSPTG